VLENKKADNETLQKVYNKRFGENALLYDASDVGSNREAVAVGKPVVSKGALSAQARKNLMRAGIQKAGEVHPTKFDYKADDLPEEQLTDEQKRYREFIIAVSPLVLSHPLERVRFIDDDSLDMFGCTKWMKEGYIFTVNAGIQNVCDWKQNYDLFIHELAHFYVQRNDHLFDGFWRAVSDIGAKLAQVALDHPELFPKAAMKQLKPSMSDKGLPIRNALTHVQSDASQQDVAPSEQDQKVAA
jgi:hypothetical protein